jgi:hypothetical protein
MAAVSRGRPRSRPFRRAARASRFDWPIRADFLLRMHRNRDVRGGRCDRRGVSYDSYDSQLNGFPTAPPRLKRCSSSWCCWWTFLALIPHLLFNHCGVTEHICGMGRPVTDRPIAEWAALLVPCRRYCPSASRNVAQRSSSVDVVRREMTREDSDQPVPPPRLCPQLAGCRRGGALPHGGP